VTSSAASYGSPGRIVLKLRTSDSGYLASPVISSEPKRNGGPLASSTARSAVELSGSIRASLFAIFAAA
jgi:hypothetical protein